MANIFQTSAGYRDPQKAMTIKALEARAKAAQDAATQSLQPTVVADPMQGIAGVLGTLGSQVQQGRAEADVSRSRNELAKLQAGITDYEHIDPNTLAQIGMLDPEQQKFLVERMLTIQNREDEQGFKAGESKAERDERARIEAERNALTARENALQRGSTEGIAAKGQEGETTRLGSTLENQRTIESQREKAAADLQTQQIGATSALETQKSDLDVLEKRKEADLALEQDPKIVAQRKADALAMGLKEGTPEFLEFSLTGKFPGKAASTNVYNQGEAPAFQKKGDELAANRMDEYVKAGANSTNFISQIKILGDLGKQVGTGKEEWIKQQLGPWAEMVGIPIEGLGEGQAYEAVVAKMVPNMRVAGSGTTSDFDARNFLASLPSLSNSPQGNAVIQATFEALDQHAQQSAMLAAEAQAGRMTWQDAEAAMRKLPYPYESVRKFLGTPKTDTSTKTEDPNDPLGIGTD